MKSEELTALGLNDEQTRQVLALNGRDIEKHKNSAATLQTRVDELTSQLNIATEIVLPPCQQAELTDGQGMPTICLG